MTTECPKGHKCTKCPYEYCIDVDLDPDPDAPPQVIWTFSTLPKVVCKTLGERLQDFRV